MILRTRFTKVGYLKYLSHLDMVRLFTRTFSKAGIPIKFSEGFNPHPKFSIGNPLPLGTESMAEYMDVELAERMNPETFIERMNNALPEGIQIIGCKTVERRASLTSIIAWSHYEIRFVSEKLDEDIYFEGALTRWNRLSQVNITKKKKKGKKKVERQLDIKPLIGNITYKGKDSEGFHVLSALLKSGESGNLKPIELVEAMERELELSIDLDMVMIKRLDVFADEDGEIKELA
ncbi:TIGR03936 family radical SAM-associated protein [Gudongella sp. SC589]|uniref:TIGR03936 family radical SAM-associated protein n=1 Tax=Gudongella sp. SC589 TaxID=3385990 RepID=UPI003904C818